MTAEFVGRDAVFNGENVREVGHTNFHDGNK